MSVYVDKASNPLGRMKMCHMMADTLDELHAMADKIGMKRKWFQNNSDHPHYDLSLSKRALAIQNGAMEIDSRQLVDLVRKWRDWRTFAKLMIPYCKRCGNLVKQEEFGFSCSICQSLLFGDAVEWKAPKESQS